LLLAPITMRELGTYLLTDRRCWDKLGALPFVVPCRVCKYPGRATQKHMVVKLSPLVLIAPSCVVRRHKDPGTKCQSPQGSPPCRLQPERQKLSYEKAIELGKTSQSPAEPPTNSIMSMGALQSTSADGEQSRRKPFLAWHRASEHREKNAGDPTCGVF
jgi:hypothetical protein